MAKKSKNDIILPVNYSNIKKNNLISATENNAVNSIYKNVNFTPFPIMQLEYSGTNDTFKKDGAEEVDGEKVRSFLLKCGEIYFGSSANTDIENKEQVDVVIEALRHWDLRAENTMTFSNEIVYKTDTNFTSFFGISPNLLTNWKVFDDFGTAYRQQILSLKKAQLNFYTSGGRVRDKIDSTLITRLSKDIDNLELLDTVKFNFQSFYELLKDKMSNPNILASNELLTLLTECVAERLCDHKTGIENWMLDADGNRVVDESNRVLKLVDVVNGEDLPIPKGAVFVLRDKEKITDHLYTIASEIAQRFIEEGITSGEFLRIADKYNIA